MKYFDSTHDMILTLTSIPPRFRYLGRIFASIARQKKQPDGVELYLAREYRRFPGEKPSLPSLPEWVKVIETPIDYGPATKILPAAERWRGKQVDLLYCDDDQNYDPHWLSRFAKLRRTNTDDALCERGWHIEEISDLRREDVAGPRPLRRPMDGRDLNYRLKRAGTLWLRKFKRHGFSRSGYLDVAEGNGGVMVKPHWFDVRAFEIPDILWTVDDVWLSGMLHLAGVRIWANHEGFIQNSFPEASKLLPLYQHLENGVDRREANNRCAAFFRDNFGIWR
jgi:hypothetical protein